MKRRDILTISLILIYFVELNAQAQRPVTIEDLATLKSASSMELSADGAGLVYVTGRDLWLLSTKPGSVPNKVGTGLLPHFSPDGRRLLYLSDKSGSMQLWMIELDGRKETMLTSIPSGVVARSAPAWSPDGNRIVFTSPLKAPDTESPPTTELVGDKDAPLIFTNKTNPKLTLSGVLPEANNVNRVSAPPLNNFDQVFVLNVQSKQVDQLTSDNMNHAARSWSPDSRSITCVAFNPRTWEVYRAPSSEVYAIDIETKQRQRLATPDYPVGQSFPGGVGGGPLWSPDGTRIAYIAPAQPLGHNTVFVVPAEGGRPVNVGAKLDRSVNSFEWVGDAKSLIVTYADAATLSIARIDTATGEVEALTPGYANRRLMSASRSGAIAWQESDGKSQGVIWVKSSHESPPVQLIDLNPQIKGWKLGEQEVIRWRGKDGEQLWGILIKPIDYRLGRKYPLIVDPYGSTVPVNDLKAVTLIASQLHAMRGYAVFFPVSRSFFAFNQYTKNTAFSKSPNVVMGDALVDDVLSGVDELIARGTVDPQRMGLFSFSTGASAINFLITRTTRFKVAVSGGGVSDWANFFLQRDVNDWTIPDMLGGKTPYDDLQSYVTLSPIYHLDKVTTPIMLIDGDRDQFLLGNIYMFNGLRRLGREVTLVRYPNEGHGFGSNAAAKDYRDRTNEFLDKYLKPGLGLQ